MADEVTTMEVGELTPPQLNEDVADLHDSATQELKSFEATQEVVDVGANGQPFEHDIQDAASQPEHKYSDDGPPLEEDSAIDSTNHEEEPFVQKDVQEGDQMSTDAVQEILSETELDPLDDESGIVNEYEGDTLNQAESADPSTNFTGGSNASLNAEQTSSPQVGEDIEEYENDVAGEGEKVIIQQEIPEDKSMAIDGEKMSDADTEEADAQQLEQHSERFSQEIDEQTPGVPYTDDPMNKTDQYDTYQHDIQDNSSQPEAILDDDGHMLEDPSATDSPHHDEEFFEQKDVHEEDHVTTEAEQELPLQPEPEPLDDESGISEEHHEQIENAQPSTDGKDDSHVAADEEQASSPQLDEHIHEYEKNPADEGEIDSSLQKTHSVNELDNDEDKESTHDVAEEDIIEYPILGRSEEEAPPAGLDQHIPEAFSETATSEVAIEQTEMMQQPEISEVAAFTSVENNDVEHASRGASVVEIAFAEQQPESSIEGDSPVDGEFTEDAAKLEIALPAANTQSLDELESSLQPTISTFAESVSEVEHSEAVVDFIAEEGSVSESTMLTEEQIDIVNIEPVKQHQSEVVTDISEPFEVRSDFSLQHNVHESAALESAMTLGSAFVGEEEVQQLTADADPSSNSCELEEQQEFRPAALGSSELSESRVGKLDNEMKSAQLTEQSTIFDEADNEDVDGAPIPEEASVTVEGTPMLHALEQQQQHLPTEMYVSSHSESRGIEDDVMSARVTEQPAIHVETASVAMEHAPVFEEENIIFDQTPSLQQTVEAKDDSRLVVKENDTISETISKHSDLPVEEAAAALDGSQLLEEQCVMMEATPAMVATELGEEHGTMESDVASPKDGEVDSDEEDASMHLTEPDEFESLYAQLVARVLPRRYTELNAAGEIQLRGGTLNRHTDAKSHSTGLWDMMDIRSAPKAATLGRQLKSSPIILTPKPAVNDDHMYPDSVTPSKVDKLLTEIANGNGYDLPYMDDEAFVHKAKHLDRLAYPNTYGYEDSDSEIEDEATKRLVLTESSAVPIKNHQPAKWKRGFNFCGCLRRH